MTENVVSSTDPASFDPAERLPSLLEGIRTGIRDLGRRGAVIAVSGGVDSGVCAGLCAKALGPERTFLLRLPEKDVGDASSDLALQLAEQLGAPSAEESITAALEGLGCYRRRDDAIRSVFPDYEASWPHKLVRSKPSGGMIVFSVTVQRPDGSEETRRMPPGPYREILAATNMKQRTRKLFEYTYADQLGYAVIGTPNLLEFDQGFFVKGGDGLADVKPIATLYKSQVYAMAEHLGLPDGIAGRYPTTETFSLPQTQEEFYFGYPYEQMDVLVWGERTGVAAAEIGERLGMTEEEVEVGYGEAARRREATRYLHAAAVVPGA